MRRLQDASALKFIEFGTYSQSGFQLSLWPDALERGRLRLQRTSQQRREAFSVTFP